MFRMLAKNLRRSVQNSWTWTVTWDITARIEKMEPIRITNLMVWISGRCDMP